MTSLAGPNARKADFHRPNGHLVRFYNSECEVVEQPKMKGIDWLAADGELDQVFSTIIHKARNGDQVLLQEPTFEAEAHNAYLYF